jgi:hypothetical protein
MRASLCSSLAPLLALVLVFGAGCEASPQAGSAAGQLATLYSDSTRWCDKQRTCKVDAQNCAARWPERQTALAAVSQLTEQHAQDCLKATLALDACALKLPCGEFATFHGLEYCTRADKLQPCCFDQNDAEVPCPDARCAEAEMQFVEQCAPLEQLIGAE